MMDTVAVELPEDLVEFFKRSQLGDRPVSDQVRIALAIHLLQEEIISVGKAASIAALPRASFELLMARMGIPAIRYDVEDYRRDRQAFERASPD